ncbi:uncharacterized protein LOC143356358 [Halictus rubicundus]|uniref:uncharacterized protein LOC143356358 n=1 Tax=Halictus rubicundus TaxID=77578 RepID=UPI0040366EE9
MATINVNSLITHPRRHDLKQFLQTHNHDIVLLSETKLNPIHNLTFKNYKLYRKDRPNAVQGGGTAILIKNNITHEPIHPPSSTDNKILECTIIKIKTTNNNTLYILSAYATNDNRSLYITSLDHLYQSLKLHNNNNYYIIAGDLNTKRKDWGDRTNNQTGRYFKKWENEHNLTYRLNTITTTTPTYKPGLSFLDICLADSRLELTNNTNGKASTLPYDSDHLAVSLRFELPSNIPTTAHPEAIKLNYRATRWKNFTKYLDRSYTNSIPTDRNLSTTDIDNNLLTISEAIRNAIGTHTSQFKTRNNTTIYINRKITKLQKHKKTLTTVLHKLHLTDPNSQLTITKIAKNTHKHLTKKLHTEFTKAINKYWTNVIKRIDHRNTDTFFPKINSIFRRKPPSTIDDIHIKQNDNLILSRSKCNTATLQKAKDMYILTTPTDKLNAIGAYYQTINSHRHLNNGTRLKEIVDNTARTLSHELATNRLNKTAITQFSEQNNAKSPDDTDDEISPFCNPFIVNNILKRLPNKTSLLLENLENSQSSPNNKEKQKPDRPLQLPANQSNTKPKQNLRSHHQQQNITTLHKHSTTHAIHKFISDINNRISNNQLVGAALLDLEKAFDSVWLNGLLFKLHRKEFPKWLIHTILDMTTDKKFVTWDGKTISTLTFHITEGLQQGTVNSPILFNIYTSDLLKAFEFTKPDRAAVLAFADNLVTYTTSNQVNKVQSDLETTVNKINNYYSAWNLRLNPQKCETILLRKPLRYLSAKIKAGGNSFQINTSVPGTATKCKIPHKKSVKYLGVYIDYLLRGNEHITKQLEKAATAFKANSRLFYNKHLPQLTPPSGYDVSWEVPICKPFTVCTTNGYIIDMFGPFYANQNDAEIMQIVVGDTNGLKTLMKRGDLCIVDRGFRAVKSHLEESGFHVFMPALKGNRSQLTTEKSNSSRKVTKVRWVFYTTSSTTNFFLQSNHISGLYAS